MKAKLIKLTSGYEHGLVAGTGRLKRDYIGLTGEILRKRCYKSDVGSHFVLVDIQFPDGALFCVEPEQVRILEEQYERTQSYNTCTCLQSDTCLSDIPFLHPDHKYIRTTH